MTFIATASSGTAAATATPLCRIVVVDAHQIFRQALQALLAADTQFDVVGTAGRADEALALIAALQPDVVLTDLQLADCPGVQLIAQVRARFPRVAVLVLTASRARDGIAAARKAGAMGYLVKERGRGELLVALRAVAAGRRYRCDVSALSALRAPAFEPDSYQCTPAAHLTERQLLLLRSIARGQRAREIAVMLGVSVRAVHKQRERLCHALQLSSTAALTRFAASQGLVQ